MSKVTSKTVTTLSLNLNDYIRFKPTALGEKVHRAWHADLSDRRAKHGVSALEYTPPVCAGGWWSMQGWTFCEVFGPHMGLGLDPVVSMDIEVDIT